MIDITNIISAGILLVFAIATTFILPPLKAWLTSLVGAAQYEQILQFADICVEAAEQTILGGERKKNAVTLWIKHKLANMGFTFTEDEIDNIIESAVYRLKNGEDWV